MAMSKRFFKMPLIPFRTNQLWMSRRFMANTTVSLQRQELEMEVAGYYGKNQNYAELFGTNIHFGYFPHISDNSQPIISFPESGSQLTVHMMDIAGINSNSNVIDFGCGVGRPIFDVSQIANCKVTGLDVTPEFIDQGKQQFGQQSDKVDYIVGSITDLPNEIKYGPKFSHIFSIQAICHVARFFSDVLREAYSILDTNGIMVINDFVVAEGIPTDKARTHFYNRLHFDHLLSFADYAEGLTNGGFEIIKFENCSKHAAYGYNLLAPQAKNNNNIEADGVPLYKHYDETSNCFTRGEIGMICVVARKK